MPAVISAVSNNSIAAEMEIVPGDVLNKINDHVINDILDYQFYAQDDSLVLEIKKADDSIWLLEIEKDYDEPLGISFDEILFDRMKHCQNQCVFCFVDQLPVGMRESLIIKDDDFRHSFINGNFITLTNLTEEDWSKIIDLHLSPLYVSVHCMQGDLRAEMLDNSGAANIKADLVRLQQAGIEVHTQIVVCPGWNDGQVLADTIKELASLYPQVASVGIVPVGLTGHRQALPDLRGVTAGEASDIIKLVNDYQEIMRSQWNLGFVYAADEFFIQAKKPLPPGDYYDDYCQIENGIGLIRLLTDEFAALEADLPAQVSEQEAYLVTGESGAIALKNIVARLNLIEGLSVKTVPVKNRYFGGRITVTGLLTGKDIIDTLGHNYHGKRVILPDVVLKEGQDVLLDNITVNQIQDRTQTELKIAGSTAMDLVVAVLGQPQSY